MTLHSQNDVNRGIVSITPELLLDMLSHHLIVNGELVEADGSIPTDGKALRAFIDNAGNVSLLIESQWFKPTAQGCEIPHVTPQYTSTGRRVEVASPGA